MQNERTARLGTAPVFPLLFKLSIPAMAGMLIQAAYNIVDSIFVGHFSHLGLAAIGLSFPIQILMMVIGVGIGIGSSSLLSRTLGAQKNDLANNIALHTFSLILVFGILTYFVGRYGSHFLLSLFVKDEQLLLMAEEYLRIILVGSVFLYFPMILSSVLRAEGNATVPMLTMLIGALINIALDPILIFGWWIFPPMGVRGAAVATVFSRVINSCFILLILFFGKNQIKLKLKYFSFDWKIYLEIFKIGVPVALIQFFGGITIAGANKILGNYGSGALAVMSLYFRLQSLVMMPLFGLGQGLMSMVGYNFGHKKPERIVQTVKISLISGTSICLLGFLTMRFFPVPILKMFGLEGEILNLGVGALIACSYGIPFIAIEMLGGMIFQALGLGVPSMVSSLIRQVIILLPVMWFLSYKFGLSVLWYAMPLSAVTSFCFMALLLLIAFPKKLRLIA